MLKRLCCVTAVLLSCSFVASAQVYRLDYSFTYTVPPHSYTASEFIAERVGQGYNINEEALERFYVDGESVSGEFTFVIDSDGYKIQRAWLGKIPEFYHNVSGDHLLASRVDHVLFYQSRGLFIKSINRNGSESIRHHRAKNLFGVSKFPGEIISAFLDLKKNTIHYARIDSMDTEGRASRHDVDDTRSVEFLDTPESDSIHIRIDDEYPGTDVLGNIQREVQFRVKEMSHMPLMEKGVFERPDQYTIEFSLELAEKQDAFEVESILTKYEPGE